MVSTIPLRPLGQTGICVSAISFGAGPVSGLMTGNSLDQQFAVLSRAVELGVNWFDTAATYGNGQSESALGLALSKIDRRNELHVATKVRVNLTSESDLRPLVIASVRASLERLQRPQITLLQIHNAITTHRNEQPTSITPDDVLGPRGILAGMEEARDAGWVKHFGLTGIGDPQALKTVINSGKFATIQAPFHLLNPSALKQSPSELRDPDYGGFLQTAHEIGMGIFAIRVFAAGAILGAEPSEHTLKTPFFPLVLYRRDQRRAKQLSHLLPPQTNLGDTALRYVLSQPEISSAIIGFGSVDHVDHSAKLSQDKEFSLSELFKLETLCNSIAST